MQRQSVKFVLQWKQRNKLIQQKAKTFLGSNHLSSLLSYVHELPPTPASASCCPSHRRTTGANSDSSRQTSAIFAIRIK